MDSFLRIFSSAAAALALALPASHADASDTLLLRAEGASVRAEVARTEPELRRGLMGRDSLPEGSGMLFVMPRPDFWCMWMRDTKIPLSVAFIESDGTVSGTEDMTPFSDALHCAKTRASFTLEVPRGWFGKNGIRPGSRFSGLPRK